MITVSLILGLIFAFGWALVGADLASERGAPRHQKLAGIVLFLVGGLGLNMALYGIAIMIGWIK